MPITRKQFELGIDSEIEAWMKIIHAHLVEHKEQAFTRGELLRVFGLRLAVRSGEPPQTIQEIGQLHLAEAALDKLVDLGVVLERDIKGTTYYSLGERPLPV